MKKIRIPRGVILALLALILAVSTAITYDVIAKYVEERNRTDVSVSSKYMFFESDYLKKSAQTYKLNSDTDEISFYLYNYESDSRISEIDLSFTVTVSSTDPDFKVNGVSSVAGVHTFTFSGVEGGSKQECKVTLSNLKAGCEYTVSATVSGGFSKQLGATFTVEEQTEGLYMHAASPDGTSIVLTVWTVNMKGNVEITIPKGFVPADPTDDVLNTVLNYVDGKYVEYTFTDTLNFNTDSSSSHSYVFMKSADYDEPTPDSGITVKIGEVTAEKKATLPST